MDEILRGLGIASLPQYQERLTVGRVLYEIGTAFIIAGNHIPAGQPFLEVIMVMCAFACAEMA
ncbi:MAG: hypothetical protein PVF95_08705 [bacterium]